MCYLLWRILRDRRYAKRIGERFGGIPARFGDTAGDCVWLHAVSVGEVLAAQNLVEDLRRRFPGLGIYVSIGTLAGRELADRRLASTVDGIFYAPLDYCFAVRRVLRRLRPLLLVVLETEIWPNLWRETKRAGAAVMVANGRISDKAFPKYRRWRWLLGPALRLPDEIFAQDAVAAERYLHLGATVDCVKVTGNLKYDFRTERVVTAAAVESFLERVHSKSVWLAASTMPPAWHGDVDEDLAVLDAFQAIAKRNPGLLLIHVPRRPERFAWVAGELERRGLRHVRRSRLRPDEELGLPGVLLVDTIGELAGLFRLADAVFLGGTLADRGGHNILEPAFFGKPVAMGPNMQNFAEIAREFRAADAVLEIRGVSELASAMEGLLADAGLREELGGRAREAAEHRRGATEAVLGGVTRWIDEAVVAPPKTLPERLLLWPLTALWAAGTAWRRRRQMHSARQLNTPVVSVGGLAMGGVGKTPFVAMLAEALVKGGYRPAILSRGYRRQDSECRVIPAGGSAPVEVTGDEAQLLLRTGAGLGLFADRYVAGRRVEEQLKPDILLLDDGFQHWRLARQLDIVLIDALDPLAGGGLFPLGRLREDPSALARAGAVVITRGHPERECCGFRRWIRRFNPQVPVFRSWLEPAGVTDAARGEVRPTKDLAGIRGLAFCGLGNPRAFWQTLRQTPLDIRGTLRFTDHHRYSPADLEGLRRSAQATSAKYLITTEKDVMNFPSGWGELIPDFPVYSLQVRLQLDDPEALFDLVRERVAGFRRQG